MEKYEERLKECIRSIEQLGADARYQEDPDRLIILLDSIEYWARRGSRLVNKNKEKSRLNEARRILEKNGDRYYLEIKNKITGRIGCASFYKDKAIVKVYEGDGSGKDDAEYTYDEFLQKYEFYLAYEK